MSSARMIEYRITRELLRRREHESRHGSVDKVILGLAIFAGVAIVSIVLPELLLPVFVASMIVTLGL